MSLAQAIAAIESKFNVSRKTVFRSETSLVVEREQIVDIALLCRNGFGFNFLLDICSVDNFGDEPRFEVVY